MAEIETTRTMSEQKLHEELLIDQKYTSIVRAARAELGLAIIILGLLTALFVTSTADSLGILPLLLAFVPIPLWWTFGMWIDRFEPEPVWLLIKAFLWGAVVATFIAGIFNSFAAAIGGEFLAASVSAPFWEEIFKGMVILWVFRKRGAHFDGVLDGLVYAIFVGAGFAVVENVQYYYSELMRCGGECLAVNVGLRGVMLPLMHPMFTAMTGIGIGIGSRFTNGFARWFFILCGFGVAMFLHSLWNTFTLYVFPLFFFWLVFLAVLVWRLRRREKIALRTMLEPEVQAGVISKEEIEVICSGGRTGLRSALRIIKTSDPEIDRKRSFRHAACHLAMLRARAKDDSYSQEDHEMESILVRYLHQNRTPLV